jgi:septum formation protein
MLKELSGRTHSVFSGFCLSFPGDNELYSGYEQARITFFALSDEEIESYLQTQEWRLAAGAYRIQQKGIRLISSIEGSYFTVAGLPIHKIFGIVRERNF